MNREGCDIMTTAKIDNLRKMREVSGTKINSGISQISVEFSSKRNLMNDRKAVEGKKILREKIGK
jgi:hypothetical protein